MQRRHDSVVIVRLIVLDFELLLLLFSLKTFEHFTAIGLTSGLVIIEVLLS